MKLMDILLAILAGLAVGYAVHSSVEADWAGPVAGGTVFASLVASKLFTGGKRRAR